MKKQIVTYILTSSLILALPKQFECSNQVNTTAIELSSYIAKKITAQYSLATILEDIATMFNNTFVDQPINLAALHNFTTSDSFKKLENSFLDASYPFKNPQWQLTTIGYFIWDLNQTHIFNEKTILAARLFEQALYTIKGLQLPVRFAQITTSQDFTKNHRVLIDDATIKNLRNEISSLIQLIHDAPLEKLLDAQYLEHTLLLELGLNNEILREFPTHLNAYYGKGLKSWQYPVQFSKFLVALSKLNVNTYLEIGCHHGGTFIIITEYLKRFNPNLKSVAVDPFYSPIMDVYTNDINTNTEYLVDFSTSSRFMDLSQPHWDISFIDGDHSFDGVTHDYDLVKNNSSTLVFHDIVSSVCPGVVTCWNAIKQSADISQIEEFIEQYQEVVNRTGNNYLGIGVLHQK